MTHALFIVRSHQLYAFISMLPTRQQRIAASLAADDIAHYVIRIATSCRPDDISCYLHIALHGYFDT